MVETSPQASEAGWLPDYATGNDAIDREHQALFVMVNHLQRAITEGEATSQLKTRLDRLAQETIAHFQHEEALMVAQQYPGFDRHKQSHDNLLAKVGKLVQGFEPSEGTYRADLIQELVRFLSDWLAHHIKGEDHKMAVFFWNRSGSDHANRLG